MRRRLKWVRVMNNADGGEFKLMQTARGVKITRDLQAGTIVYLGSRGNIKPMPLPFGIVVTKHVAKELNDKMRVKYGANWRNQV